MITTLSKNSLRGSMSDLENINKKIELVEENLSKIEQKFRTLDLEEIFNVKDYFKIRQRDRPVGYGTRGREARRRDPELIEKVFSSRDYSLLMRFFSNEYFRKRCLYLLDYPSFNYKTDFSQFFLTRKNALGKVAHLEKERQKALETGYGGFFSSKPSEAQYRSKLSQFDNELSELKKISVADCLKEEILLRILTLCDENYREVRSLDREMKQLKSDRAKLRKTSRLNSKLARAAAADQKVRAEIGSFRNQVSKTENCPYCEGKLGKKPHLDHIYPVSKGGLNSVENLVYCCANCNLTKSDKGLIQFIREQNLDYEGVCDRLLGAGKKI